ncbi:SGNH/GDSL hydrolase family protein [Flavobacterium macacae]|uniref:G-D-S-L family lipolytic protein n=1 Tax=Flavobacterium macacae TaxID=2488993 RepID=A0A3P3WFN9_9FLAO|nr:SGNH/GDSL hydrolase family protein [Flavobacterium macacae]RRJ93935.1 G-D-S-L family lipolytic protein [Flavobacterium macacae]
MIKNFKWLLFASLSIALVGCSDDDTEDGVGEVPISAGTADFSKYVALGDSFAAGFSDNALFKKGQENGYPNLLAQQFMLVGGGEFTLPLMNDNVGGLLFGGNPNPSFGPRVYLQGFLNPTTPIIVPIPESSTTDVFQHLTGTFSNLGVPGAKSFHLIAPGYGNPAGLATSPASANPYFVRMASSVSTSVLADALAQNPTFFSLWIGGNDVLGYATNGGVPTSQDPISGNDITPPATFEFAYNQLITQLTAGGRKGVVANLPYINTLPFFTTVPYNPVPLDEATATQLNTQLLGPVKQILTALGEGDRIATLTAGSANPLLIRDESLVNYATQITGALMAGGVSQAQAGLMGSLYGQARHTKKLANGSFTDFVLLTSRAVIGTPQAGVPAPFNTVGVTYPMEDKRILTGTEVAEIKVATDAYNVTIKNAADANGLALVDTYGIMNQLLNGGVRYGNIHISASFITGGAFSLDGIHPSPRGYAYIANKFLEAIEEAYGSSIPELNIGNYTVQYGQTIN